MHTHLGAVDISDIQKFHSECAFRDSMQHYPSREDLRFMHTPLGAVDIFRHSEIPCALFRIPKDCRKVANDPSKIYRQSVQVLRIPLLKDDLPHFILKKSKAH